MLASGDLEARGEPLHIPFPRTRRRLVEVVDVEDEMSLGGCEEAEVPHVRVAAALHREPARRCRREVGCHGKRGAAVIGRWGDEHALVAQRNELRDAELRFFGQELDRCTFRRFPRAMRVERNERTGRLAAPRALRGRGFVRADPGAP